MPICCQICNAEFPNLISSSHLKTHGILTSAYKTLYGKKSLASDEYRQRKSVLNTGTSNPNFGNKLSAASKENISAANKGHIAWNKGLVHTDTSSHKSAAMKRESKYKTGELLRSARITTSATRAKISQSVSEYAANHPQEMSSRAKAAIQTKIQQGQDLAIFRGKEHTRSTKDKISAKSKIAASIKTGQSVHAMTLRLESLNFTVTAVTHTHISANCNICKTDVTYTKQMFHPAKIRNDLCSVCNPRPIGRSKLEIELFNYVNSLCYAVPSYKFDSTKRTIDVYVPSANIGFEFNGLYWHSEELLVSNGNSKTKDFDKLIDANAKGIRLIQIFEDEWVNSQDIVKSRISHILGIVGNSVYARKCTVTEITPTIASEFCNKYHLQGSARSNVRLGLYYNGELVSVMTFSNSNVSRKINKWELNRFCSANYNIPGAASKLFSHFVKTYSPSSVVSYADRRWSNGNVYKQIGFIFDKFTTPGYWYLRDNVIHRIHRYSLRKQANEPANITERSLRAAEGYKTIWDCGNSKWVWHNPGITQ